MTELSDYQRLVEKPQLETLDLMIRNQAATIARLREQLLDQRCPSDTRGTIRECIAGKQCGCTNGLVLSAATKGKGSE